MHYSAEVWDIGKWHRNGTTWFTCQLLLPYSLAKSPNFPVPDGPLPFKLL